MAFLSSILLKGALVWTLLRRRTKKSYLVQVIRESHNSREFVDYMGRKLHSSSVQIKCELQEFMGDTRRFVAPLMTIIYFT